MRRSIFIAALILGFLFGCRPPSTSTGVGGSFGDGGVMIKDAFSSALGGYRLQGADLRWSGSDSGDKFSVRNTVTVMDANQRDVADLLANKLESLRLSRQWKSKGSSRSGDNYLSFSYEENGAKFFVDFILIPRDKNVEILVLYKGVRD